MMGSSTAFTCAVVLACAVLVPADVPDQSSQGSQAYALRGGAYALPSESSGRRLAPSSSAYLGNWTRCEPARLLGEWGSSGGGIGTLFELHGALVPHIYKCGGSATHTFVRHNGGTTYNTQKGGDPGQYTGMFEQSSQFKAAVVRDPLDRTLSAFHEVLARKARARPDLVNWKDYAYNTSELSATLDTILDGSKALIGGVPAVSLWDPHFRPQAKYLLNQRGEKIRLDYIGNAANLTEELEFIFRTPWVSVSRKGGPGSQIHLRDVKAAFKLSGQELARSTVRKICQAYIVDYCCFGFQFPEACGDFSC